MSTQSPPSKKKNTCLLCVLKRRSTPSPLSKSTRLKAVQRGRVKYSYAWSWHTHPGVWPPSVTCYRETSWKLRAWNNINSKTSFFRSKERGHTRKRKHTFTNTREKERERRKTKDIMLFYQYYYYFNFSFLTLFTILFLILRYFKQYLLSKNWKKWMISIFILHNSKSEILFLFYCKTQTRKHSQGTILEREKQREAKFVKQIAKGKSIVRCAV